MPVSPLAQYPYPANSQAPAAAADLMALALAVDAQTTLTATDSADRDARFGDAKVGTMVVSGASQAAWIKTGDGASWLTIYDKQTYTTGFTAATGWELTGAVASNNTGRIELRLRLNRTGNDIVAGNNGNISPDVDVATIPPALAANLGGFQVIAPFRASVTGGTAAITVSGIVRIYDMHPTSTISSGNSLYISANWNA